MFYPWQGRVTTYTDSDWAGCRVTGRSTSGGAIMIGEHYIKGWASTQAGITLSSAEAEVVAMTKAIAETIGITNMVKDLGYDIKGVVYADSSAALAVANRKGSGKLRHINIRMLWIQEQERKALIETKKVRGEVNPADLMTKYMAGTRGGDLMRRLGQQRREGRAEAALEVKGVASQWTPQKATEQRQAMTRPTQSQQVEMHIEEEADGKGDYAESDATRASMPELVPAQRALCVEVEEARISDGMK